MNAVDTNVLVYFADADEPVKQQQASQLLAELCLPETDPLLLWQVAAEFLNCLRRWEFAGRISRAETLRLFSQIEESFELVLPTRNVIHTALDLNARYSLSHWDSLLVAACIEAGVTTLYSEDMADGADYDGVRIVNPFRSPAP